MVSILMSTYNGAPFLKTQIDSILCQTYTGFSLIIRDDGSCDDTLEILNAYDDPRITVIQGDNLGPADSFFSLLREAPEADYLFFSDQDDVWYPYKLECMLSQIKAYDDVPAMVFSDFEMIDEMGKRTRDSFYDYAAISVPSGVVGLEKILAHPYVFGCASVINRKLADCLQNPPVGIEMHDCWISLTAAAIGKLVYMPQKTIAHRFHSRNATGRKGQANLINRIKRVTTGFSAQVDNSTLRLHQVTLLLECYNQELLPEVAHMLTDLSKAMTDGRIATVMTLHKYGIIRQRRINTFFFYLTVMCMKGAI